MNRQRKAAALASLTAQYSDSENDSDEYGNEESVTMHCDKDVHMTPVSKDTLRVQSMFASVHSQSNSPSNILGISCIDSLGQRQVDFDNDDDMLDMVDEDDRDREDDDDERPSSPISYHRKLMASSGDVVVPPEPVGRCPVSVQEKIRNLYLKMKDGRDMNAIIQKRKDFRNPSIYEKLIQFCEIDEFGSNYPPEIYSPHAWGPESFYDELGKRQKELMDKREKERKERTRVEFVTGTKKTTAANSVAGKADGMGKKKTKWDVGEASTTSGANARQASVIPVTVPSGTKSMVISAFGSIKKAQ